MCAFYEEGKQLRVSQVRGPKEKGIRVTRKKAEDVIEVEAEPIDSEISVFDKFEGWIAQNSATVEAEASKHDPRPIGSDRELAETRRRRTAVRKVRSEIDNERKAMLRSVEDTLKALKGEVKDMLAPLDAIDAEYKRYMDEYDEQRRADRRAMLAMEYDGFAPALAAMVPYERLASACDPDGSWLVPSLRDADAVGFMQRAAEGVANSYEDIGATPYTDEEKEELRAAFLLSLDYSATVRAFNEKRAQREAVAAFEAERAAYAAPQPEQWPEPAPAAPEPAPQPAQQQAATAYRDDPHPMVVALDPCTVAQARAAGKAMHDAAGVTGNFYGGTLEEVYRRVVLRG